MRGRLFKSIEEDISLIMLFLKNIQNINIQILNKEGDVENVASVSRTTEEMQDGLQKVSISSLETGNTLDSFYTCKLSLSEDYGIEDVREEDFEPTSLEKRPFLKAKRSLEKRPTLKAKRRLMKGDKFHLGDSSQIIEMAKKLKVLPTITVAGYISREKSGDQDEEDKVTIPECFKERMSVMLPLPILPGTRTTFPVVVNGFFALSEDRRAVKFETEDDQSDQVHYTAYI